MVRNGITSKLVASGSGSNWLRRTVMGVFWAAGIVVHGLGAYKLPRFACSRIAYRKFHWMDDWRMEGAGTKALRTMFAGLGLLLAAIAFLANANQLMSL
jgi:hypothetical protein